MKLFFKITIVVFCFLFFGCKKQFDKDYYKDCVGEDIINGSIINIIKPTELTSGPSFTSEIGYEFSYVTCNANSQNCYIGLIKNDSLTNFITEMKRVINNSETLKKINSIDTSKHSILYLQYEYYLKPSYPFYFASNHFNIELINNNLLIINRELLRTKKSNKNFKSDYNYGYTYSTCYLIIDCQLNEQTVINYFYNEKNCN